MKLSLNGKIERRRLDGLDLANHDGHAAPPPTDYCQLWATQVCDAGLVGSLDVVST
jgi:hypothetical protein